MSIINKFKNAYHAFNSETSISRRDLFSNGLFNTHGGERDMFEVLGYPMSLSWEQLFVAYRRMGIATRLTRGIARSCWRDIPEIKVDDEQVYEEELKILAKKRMFRKLEQADTLNRIGRFSILFVGVQDGEKPDQPLGKAFGGEKAINDIYFQAYSEDGTEVVEYEEEPSNPRFGMPVKYQLTTRTVGNEKLQVDTTSRIVHWTRVVHIAEDALDNDLEGMSALEPIFNWLIDLIKSEGGSSEAYWINAQRILAFMAKEGVGNADPEELEQLKKEIEEFTNGMRNGIRLGNVDVKSIDTTMIDPKETILGALKLIAGATGIPLRILTGEGGGQTTGSEDKAAYNTLIKDRQDLMCSDWLMQVLNILGMSGVIDELPINAEVDWPVNEALNELEKSEVRKNTGTALRDASQAISDIGGGLARDLTGKQLIEEVFELEHKPIASDNDDLPPDLDGPPEMDGLPGVER